MDVWGECFRMLKFNFVVSVSTSHGRKSRDGPCLESRVWGVGCRGVRFRVQGAWCRVVSGSQSAGSFNAGTVVVFRNAVHDLLYSDVIT